MSVLWPVDEFAPAQIDDALAVDLLAYAAAREPLPAVAMCVNCKLEGEPGCPCECCGLLLGRAAA